MNNFYDGYDDDDNDDNFSTVVKILSKYHHNCNFSSIVNLFSFCEPELKSIFVSKLWKDYISEKKKEK